MKNPDLVSTDSNIAIETGIWFWKKNAIYKICAEERIDSDEVTKKITKKVNGGNQKLSERQLTKQLISKSLLQKYGECQCKKS